MVRYSTSDKVEGITPTWSTSDTVDSITPTWTSSDKVEGISCGTQDFFLLLETGDHLLLEDGTSKIILEAN